METYVLGIVVPMVLSGVLFVPAERLPSIFSAELGTRDRQLLPAASATYVFAALTAGALAAAAFFLLNKGSMQNGRSRALSSGWATSA